MGFGAVVRAVVLSKVRKHISANRLSLAASLVFAGATLALAHAANAFVAGGVMVLAGLAWITMLSALNVAAVALTLATAMGLRFPLPATNALDLTPSGHWAEPAVACEHPADRGPVMMLIEYRIAPEQVADFIKAILQGGSQTRRRLELTARFGRRKLRGPKLAGASAPSRTDHLLRPPAFSE